MRIGLVCPYSFDMPGGVQFHVRDLAEKLLEQGESVQVLAPADEKTEIPDYVTSSGGALPVRYNGSVARLSFGPVAAARTQRWLAGGDFDVVHIHEPFAPSVSLIALRQAEAPVVATFHSAQTRSRALQAAYPLVRPGLERIRARIAVSEDARSTVVDHLGGDAVIIPNGVFTKRFAQARGVQEWVGTAQEPTIAFLGRLDEPRKGLQVLATAVPTVLQRHPGARFLIAGQGDATPVRAELAHHGSAVQFLGGISERDKAALLSSVDLYIAPQTGGESFGIVIIEALSAGAGVIASDLLAFQRVLDGGRSGYLFRTGDAAHLSEVIDEALTDTDGRLQRHEYAREAVRRYDWDTVTAQIREVYQMVAEAAQVQATSRRPNLRDWLGRNR
ncbi:glycosyltransferase family 4 protein [Pseudactinotalea sp. Z1739]|uniref:glycosyltransferase family 4 protein n=1 Tax=Pseudactinotalea sp. Z1739 TaxID=3413028 RepID=UPI003C7ABF26